MDTKKLRLRGPNFTSSDSALLCDVLVKHKHVIENKKTDGANLLQKQKAWLEVAEEFNAVTTGHSRTVESLQQNYKNLKKKVKKSVSSTKMDIMATGGGPPPKNNDDPIMEKIIDLVGPTIDGLYTIYDGDSSLMKLMDNKPPIELKNYNIFEDADMRIQKKNVSDGITADEAPLQATCQPIIVTPTTNVSEDVSYFLNDRANLKRKPHDLLSRKRKLESQLPEKQSVSERFKVLASQKMEFLEMQKELLNLQLTKEKESLEHQRLLRSMEVEDAKAKYAHNAELRKLEILKLNKEAFN